MLDIAVHIPAGVRCGAHHGTRDASGQGGFHRYIRSIIAWPKPDVGTCFAPCIWRAKS